MRGRLVWATAALIGAGGARDEDGAAHGRARARGGGASGAGGSASASAPPLQPAWMADFKTHCREPTDKKSAPSAADLAARLPAVTRSFGALDAATSQKRLGSAGNLGRDAQQVLCLPACPFSVHLL